MSDDLAGQIFRDFLYHAAEEGSWDAICTELDQQGFLGEQAEYFQGFSHSSEDLETHVLPAALRAGDWERFLGYAAIAWHLRGLAESLTGDEVLATLAAADQMRFADSLVAQLSAPPRRARAKAVLAACSRAGERRERVRQTLEELRSLAVPTNPAEAEERAAALAAVARHLGPELANEWAALVGYQGLDPAARERLGLDLAMACLERGGARHPGFLALLPEIGQGDELERRVLAWWIEKGPCDLELARELAARIRGGGERFFWSLAFATWSREASTSRDWTWADGRNRKAGSSAIPWSLPLLEIGGPFLAQLEPIEAEALATEMADPVLWAGFQVVRLEHFPTGERAEAAFEAVRLVPGAAERLHWALRTLAAWPDPAPQRRGIAVSLFRYLEENRYPAPATDLCRFLDLVAILFPDELGRQMEGVIWAPDSGEETLLTLVEEVRTIPLLELLLEHAESYAAVLGPSEAEAFELRARVLIRTATRLAARERSSRAIEKALVRLLPGEQDELRAAAARALAAVNEPGLATGLARQIHSQSLRLAITLSVSTADSHAEGGGMKLSELYRAAADPQTLADERSALSILYQPPLDAEALVDRHLLPMHSKERQAQALVDLAHHAQTFELRHFTRGQQDPLAPVQLLRNTLAGTGSDERLLALAIELLELAGPLPTRRALSEFHAALDAILTLEDVTWPRRIEFLEEMLSRLGPALLRQGLGGLRLRRRHRAIAHFLTRLAELPAQRGAAPYFAEVRRRFGEILPLLVGTLARMPAAVQKQTGYPARVSRWANLPDLAEEERRVLAYCSASVPELLQQAERLKADPQPSPPQVHALACLLAPLVPERVPDLVARLPRGPEQDRLCLRLLAGEGLSEKESSALLLQIASPSLRLEAETRRLPTTDRGEEVARWCQSCAQRLSRGELDLDDPASWPLLRRLRRYAETARPVLSRAVIEALSLGGRKAGEHALRAWLNAYLVPAGRELADPAGRDEEVQRALERAARLDARPVRPAADGPDTVTPEDLILRR